MVNIVRYTDAPLYDPRNHPGILSRRVQGREAGGTESSYVSISEYPPGTGGVSVTAPTEVIYLVMDGTLRIRYTGGHVDLATGDSISFAPGESRSAENVSSTTSKLIVVHQAGFDGPAK